MTSPTIQPSSAAPAQTRIGKRSSSAMISAAPATISGMLTARPITSSAMLPLAAAAIDHVVKAHDDVGDGDDPHRPPEMFRCLGLVFVRLLGHQQLGRYIKQGEPPHDLEPWQQH